MLATLFIYSVLFPPCKSGMAQGLGVGGAARRYTPLSLGQPRFARMSLVKPWLQTHLNPLPTPNICQIHSFRTPSANGERGVGAGGQAM